MLRRMPRVRSDEIHETPADQAQHEKDKTPSPIGAGLPLLQRLRLLKEKQVSWIHISIELNYYSFYELDSIFVEKKMFCNVWKMKFMIKCDR